MQLEKQFAVVSNTSLIQDMSDTKSDRSRPLPKCSISDTGSQQSVARSSGGYCRISCTVNRDRIKYSVTII